MMIDCNKAGQLLEQEQYERIGFWKKRKLKLHMRMCALCKKYENDNVVLSKIIKMAGIQYSDKCMSSEEKERIKAHLSDNNH